MLDRDVAAKAVLDNMARLKALRLAREAAEPPRPAAAPKKASASAKSKKSEEKNPGARRVAGGTAKRRTPDIGQNGSRRGSYAGSGHSIIERVLVAASYT